MIYWEKSFFQSQVNMVDYMNSKSQEMALSLSKIVSKPTSDREAKQKESWEIFVGIEIVGNLGLRAKALGFGKQRRNIEDMKSRNNTFYFRTTLLLMRYYRQLETTLVLSKFN